jgi:hypothetical protein
LAGWREVAVRQRKTKVDWAIEVARLLEGRYADCAKVILVCDNLRVNADYEEGQRGYRPGDRLGHKLKG